MESASIVNSATLQTLVAARVSAVTRFRRYLVLFLDAIAGENEETQPALADWALSMPLVSDAFCAVEAVQQRTWQFAPESAQGLSAPIDQVHSIIDAIERAIRRSHVANGPLVLRFLRRRVHAPLCDLDSILQTLLPEEAVRVASDSCLAEFWGGARGAVIVPDFADRHQRYELRVRWAWDQHDPNVICRALRTLTLHHFAWGCCMPQDWSSEQQSRALELHKESLPMVEHSLCFQSVLQRTVLLEWLDRRRFEEQASKLQDAEHRSLSMSKSHPTQF